MNSRAVMFPAEGQGYYLLRLRAAGAEHVATVSAQADAILFREAPAVLEALEDLLWAVDGFGDFAAQYPDELEAARKAASRARQA